MAYPYQQNSFFPGGQVSRFTVTTAATTVAAADIVNVPPGEHIVDIAVVGVASVSAISYKAYAYCTPAQDAAKAVILDLVAIGSGTSATVITIATSSVSPVQLFRAVGFDEAPGYDGIQLPFGMYISATISSVTTTTGSSKAYIMASPRT